MKKVVLFIFMTILMLSFFSCKQEDEIYDANVKIDSLRQDSVLFGTHYILENLHVYYTIENNDFANIHSYIFTVKATTVDSSTYSYVERGNNGIQGGAVKSGEFEMGISSKKYVWAQIESYTFE